MHRHKHRVGLVPMMGVVLKGRGECICYSADLSGFSVCGVICPAHMERAELTKFSDFLDKRPLTDETLKELGFEYVAIFPDCDINKEWKHPEYQFEILRVDGKIESIRLLYDGGNFKTVGSVKMLIEALKGD